MPSTFRSQRSAPASQRGTTSGFTLIELLVVIAIIALLAAVLFPVFTSAREKAREATCASNLKEVLMATRQYIQDFDGTWPITRGLEKGANSPASLLYDALPYLSTDSPVTRSIYANALYPYVKTWDVWACPSSDELNLFNEPRRVVGTVRFSYALNGYVNASSDAVAERPAETVAYTEVGRGAALRYFTAFPHPHQTRPEDPVPYRWTSNANDITVPWYTAQQSWWVHGEGTNYAYMDGHVSWVHSASPRSAWTGTDGRGVTNNVLRYQGGPGGGWMTSYGLTNRWMNQPPLTFRAHEVIGRNR